MLNRPSLSKSLPKASALDTAKFLSDVFLPNIAKGPIIRRPKIVALAQRLRLDERSVRRMKKLHTTYGEGPLLLRIPFRKQAVVLTAEHVHEVLNRSPDPFSPASDEKRAALAHFQPDNSLISKGEERSVRRALQEQVLDSHSPVHRLAGFFLPIIEQEAAELVKDADARGELVWDDFSEAWYRVVRRIVFGDAAREDRELTNMIIELRSDANWAFLKPIKKKQRARFLQGVKERMNTAGEGSLAHVMAEIAQHDDAAPANQIPQWLFAFDPAGMATFRTLAALSTQDHTLASAREEINNDTSGWKHLPYLRSSVLEALRLWPTTPLILRQTTRNVSWGTGTIPKDCGVLIHAPSFHRDELHLTNPHRFEPERWNQLEEITKSADWALIPFSEGPVVCPGRQLVLMVTSAMLAHLIEARDYTLKHPHPLDASAPLPGTLNNYGLQFSIHSRNEHDDSAQGH